MSGLLIAAPSSGSGKTTVTLGLLRALSRRGETIAPGKAGPDYIDPAFHAAAVGTPCLNFDPWAMRPELLLANAHLHMAGGRTLIVEAMMGLFDSAADGCGSPADLAATLGMNIVLVVDASRMSQSVAALVGGFVHHRVETRIAGVILNRVGSEKHQRMLVSALDAIRMPVLGVLRSDKSLTVPERHLGLVQATEHGELESFLDRAADRIAESCDIDRLLTLASALPQKPSEANILRLAPLGQKIAVARDVAFAFSYEHMLLGWRRRGAEISFFSPLANEAPAADCDAIYLPGGYPELHAGALASANRFRDSLRSAHTRDVPIYGECGGYMALGEALIDAAGTRHAMLGLLPLVTSFEQRKRHLGYRRVRPIHRRLFTSAMMAHEFHYSQALSENGAERLFEVADAEGNALGPAGLVRGSAMGSYIHLIDLQPEKRA